MYLSHTMLCYIYFETMDVLKLHRRAGYKIYVLFTAFSIHLLL